MKWSFKLWLWVMEFKMRRRRDKAKIEFLTKELLKEIEAQGYTLKSTDDLYGIDIQIFISNKQLMVDNGLSHWNIPCGYYSPIIEKREVTKDE